MANCSSSLSGGFAGFSMEAMRAGSSSVPVVVSMQVAPSARAASFVQVASSALVERFASPVQVAPSALVAGSPCPGGLPQAIHPVPKRLLSSIASCTLLNSNGNNL
jgi:hypothetical protein